MEQQYFCRTTHKKKMKYFQNADDSKTQKYLPMTDPNKNAGSVPLCSYNLDPTTVLCPNTKTVWALTFWQVGGGESEREGGSVGFFSIHPDDAGPEGKSQGTRAGGGCS
jgi:hypothetical protein